MEIDADRCYRALLSRDARFDGRFFVGVRTTGVYCRPVCPARTPKRVNVRFFACAAAAAEAGFRACLRCRPETSPGTPAWLGTSATVSRALRLIADGALDREDVAALAAHTGVGERHLRRLFHERLGASPLAVAQTRRVHFAKKLLDETALPMTEVALGAGFASLRRFNAAMQAAYGRAPRELRRSTRAARANVCDAVLELRLTYRPPYDWDAILAFLAARAIPGVEHVTAGAYRRTIALPNGAGVLEVRPDARPNGLRLRVPAAAAPRLAWVVERVRRLFDLGADPTEIGARLARDAQLREILRARPGLRVPGAWNGFELGVRAILGQQVSVAGATTLAGRLAARFGNPLAAPTPELAVLFPTPAALAAATARELGVPAARATAVRALAAAVRDGALDLDAPLDPDATLAQLQSLPGIGPWTAQYVALRALREPDAFPAGDLGLRRALTKNGRPLPERELAARAEAWRPWRAYAAIALWTRPLRDNTRGRRRVGEGELKRSPPRIVKRPQNPEAQRQARSTKGRASHSPQPTLRRPLPAPSRTRADRT